MITELLMKPGRFDVQLRPDTPLGVMNAIDVFDHVVVVPTWFDPITVSDATILSKSIYTGVIREMPTVYSLTGSGLAFYLGDEDGLGDVLDVAVSGSSASLPTWITALLPSSLVAGTVAATGTNLTYAFQYMSRREAIDYVCRQCNAEWRVNMDGTFDANSRAALFTTTPTVVIQRKGEGPEGDLKGVQAVQINQSRNVYGYTTKVYTIGQRGDGAKVTVASASSSASGYKDLFNNNIVLERLVDAPSASATDSATIATQTAALYGSVRRNLTLSSDTFDVPLSVQPGDSVYVYDLENRLYDTANKVVWRGELITPINLRCRGMTWPITTGMGVFARRSGATPTYTDLTPYVVYEDGQPTTWTVGNTWLDPDQDPTQLNPAYLGAHALINARVSDPDWVSYGSTYTNTTGYNGTTSYRVRGNKCEVQLNSTAGTVTANGTISFTVPSFVTPAKNCTFFGSQGTTGFIAKLSTSGGCVIYKNTTGGNWTAGDAINDLSLTLLFPIT